MSKEWIDFFYDCARLGLFLALIPILIFVAYYVDLRLCPQKLTLLSGNGKKGRRSRQNLEVLEEGQE